MKKAKKVTPLEQASTMLAARMLARQRIAEKRPGGLWMLEAGARDKNTVQFDSRIMFDAAPTVESFAMDDWLRLTRVGADSWILQVGDLRFTLQPNGDGRRVMKLTDSEQDKRKRTAEFIDKR